MSFDAGEELFVPQSNDVCYNKNGELGKFENDPLQDYLFLLLVIRITKKPVFIITSKRFYVMRE